MKRINGIIVLKLVVWSCFWIGCNRIKEPINPVVNTRNYFPLAQGLTRQYSVIETTYTTTRTIAARFKRKELHEGTWQDLTNRTHVIINVYTDENQADYSFVYRALGYADQTRAELFDNNTRYVIQKYPIEANLTWDGNQFNNKGRQDYRYLSIDTTWTVNGKTYEHCIFILQKKILGSLLNDSYAYEVYAPEIGKIEKYDKNLIYIQSGIGLRELSTESYIYHEKILP